MHPRTGELVALLERDRDVLYDAFTAVPADRRGARPAADSWSPAEVVDHLAVVEERIGGLLAQQFAEARDRGLGAETESGPVAGRLDLTRILDRERKLTASPASQPAGRTPDEAWAAFQRGHERIVETVRAMDGLALGEVQIPHPVFGPIDGYQWLLFVAGHRVRHAAQIREIA